MGEFRVDTPKKRLGERNLFTLFDFFSSSNSLKVPNNFYEIHILERKWNKGSPKKRVF